MRSTLLFNPYTGVARSPSEVAADQYGDRLFRPTGDAAMVQPVAAPPKAAPKKRGRKASA